MRRELLVCIGLILITLVVYGQVRHFDFVRYDDDRYVTQNGHVRAGLDAGEISWAFTSVHASNWHPLTWMSHMLDVEIYGLKPGGHHLTSVFFHLLNSLLLFLVLKLMTGALWRSAFAAALFAVHPLHVESVAWVAERKDVLSTFFWMLTLWAYVRYTENLSTGRYLCVLLSFMAGLMAKPMLVTLPFVLLLLDYWPLGRFQGRPSVAGDRTGSGGTLNGRLGSRTALLLVYEKLPLFLAAGASAAITLIAQRQEIASLQSLPLSLRIGNALVACVGYLGKMLWPEPLAVFYPYPSSVPVWKAAAAGLLLVLISFGAIRMVKRRPYLAVGWFWYIGTLVPVVGIVQVGVQSMADRYTYVPLIGLFILTAWGIADVSKRMRYRNAVLAAAAAVILCAGMFAAWSQTRHWQNSGTLFAHTLAVTKDNYVIHNNMGALLAEQGDVREAVRHYMEALRIKPDDLESRYNLGNIMLRQGHFKEALAQYADVIRHRPGFAPAHNNMGIALSALGRQTEAVPHFREALRIDPDYEDARLNLEKALFKEEKPRKEAVSVPGSQADPASAEGRMHRGLSLVAKGKIDEAISQFREALKVNPNLAEAHVSLGLAFARKQKLDEAIVHFRRAVKLKPGLSEAHNSLGVALAYQGKLDEAIPEFQEALRINPRFAKAHNSLGVVLARRGRLDDAARHLREAVRLKPDYEEARRNLKLILGMQGKSGAD